MSFHYFDQPSITSANAELVDITGDYQQFNQAHSLIEEEENMGTEIKEETIASENSRLTNIISNQQFDQPSTSSANAELIDITGDYEPFDLAHNLTIKEETMILENAGLANMHAQQSGQPLKKSRMKEVIQNVDRTNSIEPNYSTLLSMFPNVDAKYIRQICIKPPFNNEEGNSLVMLINHLLSYEEKIDEALISELNDEQNQTSEDYLLYFVKELEEEENKIKMDKILSEMLEAKDRQAMEEQKRNENLLNELLFSEFLQKDKVAVVEKMQILENILPDADPNILKKFVEKNHENANSLEEFVESNLQHKNYKKRDQYYARLRTKERIEEYTTGFDLERFIKQFPDPFEHFENPEREGAKQEKALNFLINRYNFDARYIDKVYAESKYNLSLADKNLQNISGIQPTAKSNIDSDNIPLLQEIAYIENKSHIRKYLDVIRKKEEQEMDLLRAQKLLLECQCCYDDVKPTECIECDNNHIFCKRCIIKGTDLALSNGEISVKCFRGAECTGEFSLNILRRVLSPHTFDIFLNKRQEFEIKAAKLDGLVNCPFCPYSMELAPQIQIFTCKNPECMKITCRLCKRMNHLPIKCEDVLDEHKGRLFVEEEMSKELIRYCPRCNTPFVKLHGCNYMTCRCGASMCYICKTPLQRGSNHFHCNNNSDQYEREQVELRRVQALTKLRQDFPDLKLPDV
ncbi:uncharacterized protein LOC103317441 isoform X1 [Nasonia vitripennis]|uniref:RING-type domain-containing protein n=1 Tax=Nasonia vitripennis TaxID=7425 RepID=A0A7M7Q689_NASVI|nr:uncharacterized protein LOC103317441 isoform X1 [Nasonia vitripennis]